MPAGSDVDNGTAPLSNICASASEATTIKGVVVDSLTREPIPFAMVLLQGSSAGTQADADGRFDITTKVNFLCANFSMMGYAPKDIYVSKGEVNDLPSSCRPTAWL